jgi:hypothetical protein
MKSISQWCAVLEVARVEAGIMAQEVDTTRHDVQVLAAAHMRAAKGSIKSSKVFDERGHNFS